MSYVCVTRIVLDVIITRKLLAARHRNHLRALHLFQYFVDDYSNDFCWYGGDDFIAGMILLIDWM